MADQNLDYQRYVGGHPGLDELLQLYHELDQQGRLPKGTKIVAPGPGQRMEYGAPSVQGPSVKDYRKGHQDPPFPTKADMDAGGFFGPGGAAAASAPSATGPLKTPSVATPPFAAPRPGGPMGGFQGGAPSGAAAPAFDFAQAFQEELEREKGAPGSPFGQPEPAMPTDVQIPPELQTSTAPNIMDASQGGANLYMRLRQQLRGMPRGSAERRYGVVEEAGKGPGGEPVIYRLDRHKKAEDLGYIPNRAMGPYRNFGLRLAQDFGGVREQNIQSQRVRAAQELKRQEIGVQAGTARAGIQAANVQAGLEGQRNVLTARGNLNEAYVRAADRAGIRYRDYLADQHQERILAMQQGHYERMEALQHGDKPMSALDQLLYDAIKDNPRLQELYIRGKLGKEAGIDVGPKSWKEATELREQLSKRSVEMREGLSKIDGELESSVFPPNLAGNEAVSVYIDGKQYSVPPEELGTERQRLIEALAFNEKQLDRLGDFMSTGDWPDMPAGGDSGPASAVGANPKVSPEGPGGPSWADRFRATLGETFQFGRSPGGTPGAPGAVRPPPPSQMTPSVLDKFPPPPMPEGPGPQPGNQDNQRAEIPDQETLQGMSYKQRVFYSILAGNPGMDNRTAAKLAREAVESGAAGPSMAPPPFTGKQ